MKKKTIMFSVAALLLLGFCSIAFAGNKVLKSFQIDTGDGIISNKIPCWSAGNNPQGCTSVFILCMNCEKTTGIPMGEKGTCN